MNKVCLNIKMELLEDILFNAGHNLDCSEDIGPVLDREGRPIMPGSTLKGLLRESINNYLCWTGNTDEASSAPLFAGTDFGRNASRHLVFSNLKLEKDCTEWTTNRKRLFTKNGRMFSVFNVPCIAAGNCFYGTILCDSADVPLVEKGLLGIHWAGSMRNRGMGRVRFSICSVTTLPPTPAAPESHWLHYRLRLETPMIITWSERSSLHNQDEKSTESRNYLPGSAVRGFVMNALVQQNPDQFHLHKASLLNHIYFGNALPMAEGKELIPTPKGFYADKQQTCFYSVLQEDVRIGHKRAELGSFCYLQDGIIHHHSPVMDQNFRASKRFGTPNFSRAIGAGTELAGYIYLRDPALAPLVASVLSSHLYFGAFRYAGNGKCTLVSLDTKAPEYFRYSYRQEDPIGNDVYMLLLSGCTMSRHGQACGLDPTALAEFLGIPEVLVHRCATSIMEPNGYNNKWHASLPISVMYSPGSIFRLSFPQGTPSWQTLQQLQTTGLGMRTPEGFGQILFLKDFAHLQQAQRILSKTKILQSTAHFRSVRCAWLLDTPLSDKVSNSTLFDLQTICRNLVAGEAQAESQLRNYLDAITEAHMAKRLHQGEAFTTIRQVLDQPLEITLNCPGYPDSFKERVRLLADWIEVKSRKGY
jgi:hypothetical protein